jgi:hypothetical protein
MTGTRIEGSNNRTASEVQLIDNRRGFPVYATNPSARDIVPRLRDKRPIRIEGANKLLIYNPCDGDIVGEGDLAFVERQVVDKEKFIKVYLEDFAPMFDMSKTAQRVFQLIWEQLRDAPNGDKVELSPRIARTMGKDLTDRVVQKGVRELLQKEFIFMSPTDGIYFINMARFFNGNRIVKVREYTLEGTQESLHLPPPEQKQLS